MRTGRAGEVVAWARPGMIGSAAAPDTPQTWNDPDHSGFRRAFAVIFLHAQQSGDVPQAVTPDSLGAMFEAQLMSAMHDWAADHAAPAIRRPAGRRPRRNGGRTRAGRPGSPRPERPPPGPGAP